MVNTTVGVLSGSSFSFHNCSVTLKPKHPLQCTWINSCVQSLCSAGSSGSNNHPPLQHYCEQPADNYNTTLVPSTVNYDSYSSSSSSSSTTTSALLLSTVVICLVLALVVLGVTLWNVYQHYLHPRLLNWPAAAAAAPTTTPTLVPPPPQQQQQQQQQQHGSPCLVPRRSRYTNGYGTIVVSPTSTSTTSREL